MKLEFLTTYHLVSQSMAALCSCRWPAPWPALARVAMMTMSSGKPVPSPLASMSVAMGMSVLRRTVHTPSPTWLLSRTIWVVSTCRSCRFSWTTSSCSESLGGVAVMRVSQDWRRDGSTHASWARDPHRQSRLGFGLFSAGDDKYFTLLAWAAPYYFLFSNRTYGSHNPSKTHHSTYDAHFYCKSRINTFQLKVHFVLVEHHITAQYKCTHYILGFEFQ